jgi:glutamate-1-semialdehyde 2,1-aminomutase
MSRWKLDLAEADYRERTPRSAGLFARASRHFPGGSTRVAAFFEPYPAYLQRGEGAYVWDVDGNRRLDFDANFGLLIHGQCFPPVVERVRAQAGSAHCFAAPTPLEIEWAEAIKARLPSVQRLRFTASGSEAAALAVRAARAFTARAKIAKFTGGYHGSSDVAALNTPGSTTALDEGGSVRAAADGPGLTAATVREVIALPFNDEDGVRRVLARHAGEIAAVFIEPVQGAAGLIAPRDGFLGVVRELASAAGALLVFDEVMMFRLSFHGAQGLFGVSPDLTLLGKLIGGGLPVGVLGGRADVMAVFDATAEGSIRHSGTYNGHPLAAAAGLACMEHLTPDKFDVLRRRAGVLVARANDVLRERRVPASWAHVESMFNLHGSAVPACTYEERQGQDRTLARTLHLGLLNAGIQLTPSGMGSVSTVMDDTHVEAFVDALRFVVRRYVD